MESVEKNFRTICILIIITVGILLVFAKIYNAGIFKGREQLTEHLLDRINFCESVDSEFKIVESYGRLAGECYKPHETFITECHESLCVTASENYFENIEFLVED